MFGGFRAVGRIQGNSNCPVRRAAERRHISIVGYSLSLMNAGTLPASRAHQGIAGNRILREERPLVCKKVYSQALWRDRAASRLKT